MSRLMERLDQQVVWRSAERATRTIESSDQLDRAGMAVISFVGRYFRPGALKDLLSGTWMGHPLHPALTDVPVGAWTSSLVLDMVPSRRASQASDKLVALGVLAAVPTALTGLSEYADVVRKEERTIGVVHATGNTLALLLYLGSYIQRKRGRRARGLFLSTLGAGAMLGSGFLGGHLAFRRGVGVDQTLFRPRTPGWTPVLPDADLVEGTPAAADLDGTRILLYRSGARIHAIANRCSHRGGPLHKGTVEGGQVECPWHLSRFHLDDGSVARGPATAPQPSYEARVRNGQIELRTRPSASLPGDVLR
jgi:nitrite reductase/ring-hydroxylating ferredoxin subunit/uncharacterized membrane protein